MSNTFYVTTPIYYVNDVPHIGHAYTTIAADVLARFYRLTGHEVFFLTGLDEHGQKVQQAAAKAGIDPQAHCDLLTPKFKNLWSQLHISNNGFIRTTDLQHQAIVQRYLQVLYDKDLIYQAEYTGWYCTFDERFWTEKDVENGLCPDCRRPVEQVSERNYFFRMSRFQSRLKEHIQQNPDFIQPDSRRNEVLGFLQKPLEDLSISRPKSRLSWGVELPFDRDCVAYVWFDALVNYLSALEYISPTPSTSTFWPASLHLVGKDILTTHAVYWSTMLMGLELPLPQSIFAHGWWTVNGEKMSKSRGNVVDPYAVVEEFGADAFRYFLLREVPFGQDGDFSISAFGNRYNAELANDLGNLLSRTLTMLANFSNNSVPQPDAKHETDQDRQLQHAASSLFPTIDAHLRHLEFNRALETTWGLVQSANQYIDKTAPWKLAKDPGNTPRLHTVLFHLTEVLRFLTLAVYPFMPQIAETMKTRLGLSTNFSTPALQEFPRWGAYLYKGQTSKGPSLFPRRDSSPQESQKSPEQKMTIHPNRTHMETPQTVQSTQQQPAAGDAILISIADFQKIQLKVAKILTAERVPKSEKLLKLQVDIGTEQRQIVAGIGKKYAPEELVGRTIVVVANLKPAKLMGIESQGMVLAAGDQEVLELLNMSQEIPAGTRIK
ncbi:MAG TPA: methionine--tRNA ligase [Nitrospirales bacterium]|nr:methionine--tRNA ligase [Nitrospirales bacterium]